ncbi:hypothetical protein AGABI2DRAFT_194039 [Agaricus bisporus var. bisporus H97]|uniref:hypothetical protein n=1 Tax=Agaricus bisporus var. bisporus (strain H97 / ATCC MYA-4626 / FGSC 10389) TaxID=936046 RepID=UPI00029F552D|nr:hypothetical protein AGABI2DRAFT_194039 [Agaricus bisporus var. bisporus H97]EKV46178.1 hypothetical protein AGABI2DRAFT_194039 [Agaricus bisporus var. bisporus H97]
MRFAALLAAAVAATTSVGAVPAHQPVESRDFSFSLNLGDLFDGFDLSNNNHYGAPIPPWVSGSKPGWYYGPHPGDHPHLPCLGGLICRILDLIPFFIHCPHNYPHPPTDPTDPPPADGYTNTFHNISAAVQADDYMTFGLVETVAACKAMCDSVDGCGFANSYHDVNGKDGSPLLTCALFRGCHGPEDADNEGGQSQPDGSINFIAESDGWCKQ